MNSKVRASLLSPLIVIGLFSFMGALIFQSANLKRKKTDNINISFLRNYKERAVEDIDRKKPEKPKDPMKAPDAPKVSVNKPEENKMLKMDSFASQFDASALGSGLAVGGYGVGGDENNRGLTVLVAIEPIAPTRARIEGIKGNATVKFDVNAQGLVENVTVVQSKPAKIFDQAVIQAIYASRFKPKTVEGKPVAVRGNFKSWVFDYSK